MEKINEKLFEAAFPGVHEKVFSLLINEPQGKLLDAPAGSGAMSRKLKEAGFDVVAADLNPDAFKATEVNFQKVDLNNNLPFPDNFFNYIVCVEGIEHLENPFRLLREFARVLCKGGKLILTTPNVLNIHYRMRYLLLGSADRFYAEILKRTPSDTCQFLQQHINPIDFIKLKYILKENNFIIEGIFTNRSVLPYLSDRLYLRPFVISVFFLSTILVRLFAKLFKHNDPLVNELVSKEILSGETLILKVKKE